MRSEKCTSGGRRKSRLLVPLQMTQTHEDEDGTPIYNNGSPKVAHLIRIHSSLSITLHGGLLKTQGERGLVLARRMAELLCKEDLSSAHD